MSSQAKPSRAPRDAPPAPGASAAAPGADPDEIAWDRPRRRPRSGAAEAPHLSGAAFHQAFPFFLTLASDGAITAWGAGLRRLVPELKVGDPWTDHFTLERPAGSEGPFGVPLYPAALVVLRHNRRKLRLRGQLAAVGQGRRAFLGSPVLDDLQSLQDLGLTVADLAPHDASVDVLLSLRAHQQDLTASQELVQLLQQTAREAAHSRALSRDLLSSLSHELRTPLHGLKGSLAQVEQAQTLGEARELLAQAQGSLVRLDRLVSSVLDLVARTDAQSGAGARARELCALAPLLAAAVESTGRVVTVEVVPGLRCQLDREGVQSATTHLLDAVAEDLGGLPLVLAAELEARTPAEGVLHLRVRVDEDHAGTALASREPTESPMAAHLLMASVELLGGTVHLPGDASEAGISVPVTLAPRRAAGRAVPLRVLVVDDDRANRRLASWALSRAGHEVGLAANGDEAVEAVRERQWDVILMDVRMPILDGIGATRLILGADGRPPMQVPPPSILGFTAHGLQDERNRCLDVGMLDVLQKPMPPAELVLALAERVAPLDWTETELRVGARALPAWLLSAFADDLLENARQLAAAPDVAAARELVHRIAGAAGSYGYEGLTELARQLSTQLRRDEPSPALRARLCRLIEKICADIPRVAPPTD